MTLVRSATTADRNDMGMCTGVSRFTLTGTASPSSVPTTPPDNDRKTASVRNCRRISRRVAPSALRMPISRMRAETFASMLFMMPTPDTTSVMKAAAVRT